MWYLSDWLNIKYDSEITYLMMVEKISEKNFVSKREDWRNMDDSELYTSDCSSDIIKR
jgi:hypothetical protein